MKEWKSCSPTCAGERKDCPCSGSATGRCCKGLSCCCLVGGKHPPYQVCILDPSVFTIYSCKATLLSWSAQRAHLLTEAERLQQGHHRISAKGSLRLYSRDDVYRAWRLQGIAGCDSSRRAPQCPTTSRTEEVNRD